MATTAKGFSYSLTDEGAKIKVVGLFTERELDAAILGIRKQNEQNRLTLKYKEKPK